jgi:hypothetical protein
VVLAWDERKRLLRVTGVAEALLESAHGLSPTSAPGFHAQLDALIGEARELVRPDDEQASDELARLIPGAETDPASAELRAAALVGWLKAELTVQAIEDQREDEAGRRRRKQTIGFIRRFTRETPIPDRSEHNQTDG